MTVLLYQKRRGLFAKSGVGRAMAHQIKALEAAGVKYVLSPNENYDIVHLNTLDPASKSMARKAHKQGKKVIFHAHTTIKDFKNSFTLSNVLAEPFKDYLIKMYQSADLLITPTPYSKNILDTYGLGLEIVPISNGIDLKHYAYSEDKVQKYRDYFKIQPNQKVIISVGYYFERKGFHDFVEIAKALPEYTFIWFGYSSKLSVTKTIRKALKNPPTNLILPGYISGDIIEGAWLDSDLFFFPSYEETEGIVVLEALASKAQILLRDIPVYNPWLDDEVHCYKGKDNLDFIELINQILNGTLPSTRTKAYEVAETKSIANVGDQLKETYTYLLNKSND